MRFFEHSISGDRAAHAARGVGPATDYETPMRTVIDAPFAGSLSRRDGADVGFGLKLTGDKYIFVGAHLDDAVRPGRKAWRADIARSGNTGQTTGPHFHCYIIIRATGERISFKEWLDQYVNGPKSAPKPAGKPTKTLVGSTIVLGSWYWYATAANADKFIDKQGKKAGQNMLSGPYTVLAVAANGSIQVQSNGNRTKRNPKGLVWVHESAAGHVKR
ncbi:hypothetical protein ACIGEP_15495 [Microbacterium sp. NPDC077663]|uniref:hypothetical protein n=1 Tax=Microbacterium sp. NPDC077663 TaxID=3364189 RepID=UPI0037C6052F